VSTIPHRIIALALCLAAAGCISLPRDLNQRLAQAAAHYQTIQRGMARQAVIAVLGAPQLAVAEGRLRWEERYGAGNFEAIEIKFNSSDMVESVVRISHRVRHFPGFNIDGAGPSGGAPSIYHDYDYGWDGNVRPYPPAPSK